MNLKLWARWAAMHGVPRSVFAAQALRGDPLARLLSHRSAGLDEAHGYIDDLRGQGRLVRTPYIWATADYEIARSVLRDKRFGVPAPSELNLPGPLRALIAKTNPGVANPVEPPSMVSVNPPDHTRYRKLVARSFTPRATEQLNARIGEMTKQLIESLPVDGETDLIGAFALQLPIQVIAEILDLPEECHDDLSRWGQAGTPLLDIGISWPAYRDGIEALRSLEVDLVDHYEKSRTREDGNPFTRLASNGDLSVREFTANASLLIGAGFETTVNLIGNGLVRLHDHPEQLRFLLDNPDAWPNAIEEILRLDSPVQMTLRTALVDMDLVDGQRLSAGESVVLLLGGANRDPAIFTDPHRFDVMRNNAKEHLAFASGIHACVGAPLARTEGVTALRELFAAFPDLRLATVPTRRHLVTLNGYSKVTARLTQASATPGDARRDAPRR